MNKFVSGFLVGILGGLGVTGGAHRLWAHRSYKAKLPFKIFILILFTLAGQVNFLNKINFVIVYRQGVC